jgi:uncharacterized protein (TIGR04255 family)
MARGEFPRVFVPKLKAGDAVALSPYRFQRNDESASLLTALNLFAYQTSEYPGFPRFSHDALKWIRAFGELFEIGPLTRTGLRYTNIIPYAPVDLSPVTDFLDVSVRLGVVESLNLARFSFSAVIPTASGGMLTVQIQEMESEDGESAILLDFDFALSAERGSDGLHLEQVERYLHESHTETKRLFEGLLTERYRRFLRGEGLE